MRQRLSTWSSRPSTQEAADKTGIIIIELKQFATSCGQLPNSARISSPRVFRSAVQYERGLGPWHHYRRVLVQLKLTLYLLSPLFNSTGCSGTRYISPYRNSTDHRIRSEREEAPDVALGRDCDYALLLPATDLEHCR